MSGTDRRLGEEGRGRRVGQKCVHGSVPMSGTDRRLGEEGRGRRVGQSVCMWLCDLGGSHDGAGAAVVVSLEELGRNPPLLRRVSPYRPAESVLRKSAGKDHACYNN